MNAKKKQELISDLRILKDITMRTCPFSFERALNLEKMSRNHDEP